MDCKSFIPQFKSGYCLKKRGRGGMVDTTDLKSVDFTVVRVQVPPPPSSFYFDLKYLVLIFDPLIREILPVRAIS